jgi:DHA2 family lincomycin resistance protein-like MFS transporter
VNNETREVSEVTDQKTSIDTAAPYEPVDTAHDETSTQQPATNSRRNMIVIALLLVSAFVMFLNETIMNVALPDIMKAFGVEPATGQWLTTAFLLTMAVVIPITGFLLQRFNTRTIYIAAIGLFTVGTLAAALAPAFPLLVAARVVQASGTAIMMPLLMTTVLTLVPPSDLGRIMGRISIVMSVAPALGPTFSGLILSAFSWQFVFWFVLPLGIAALVLGLRFMQNVTEPRVVPIDVLSVIVSAFGFGGLVYGLSLIGEAARGESPMQPWIPLVVGGVSLVAFVLRQIWLQRGDRALLDLRVFQSRNFTISISLLCLSMLALFGTVIILPIYVVDVLGQEPLVIGLLLLPGGLLMGILGPFVGRLYDRFGPTPLVVPGAIVVSLSFWGMTFLNEHSPVWVVLIAHIGISLGLAFMFTPIFTAGPGSLKPHLYGHGSAILTTLQQVAGAAGTSLFIALMVLQASNLEASGVAPIAATAGGMHLAFTVGAILSMGAIVLAAFVRRPADQPDWHAEHVAQEH